MNNRKLHNFQEIKHYGNSCCPNRSIGSFPATLNLPWTFVVGVHFVTVDQVRTARKIGCNLAFDTSLLFCFLHFIFDSRTLSQTNSSQCWYITWNIPLLHKISLVDSNHLGPPSFRATSIELEMAHRQFCRATYVGIYQSISWFSWTRLLNIITRSNIKENLLFPTKEETPTQQAKRCCQRLTWRILKVQHDVNKTGRRVCMHLILMLPIE